MKKYFNSLEFKLDLLKAYSLYLERLNYLFYNNFNTLNTKYKYIHSNYIHLNTSLQNNIKHFINDHVQEFKKISSENLNNYNNAINNYNTLITNYSKLKDDYTQLKDDFNNLYKQNKLHDNNNDNNDNDNNNNNNNNDNNDNNDNNYRSILYNLKFFNWL
jgi:hypothetical protein